MVKIRCYVADSNTKIIFAPIIGMSLSIYNQHTSDTSLSWEQDVLNRTIHLINREIVKINDFNHVVTPWLTRMVHRRYRRSNSNSYHRLAPDGCHLSKQIYIYWASAIYKAFLANLNYINRT